MLGIRNYTLTICEKPDAARKIASAIAIDGLREERVDGLQVYVSKMNGRTFVVCYAFGHLYTLEDPGKNRHVYPVFDVKWVPLEKFRVKQAIRVISNLAKDASDFVNACDFDQEGEVIGYNILKYACGNKHEEAFRAKFSTLTETELRDAFGTMKRGTGTGLAKAGIARHVLDFIYGVNLSRALAESVYKASKKFRNLTIGRVQGPTLYFVVEREKEIRAHVPIPYWQVNGKFEKDGEKFGASYEEEKIAKFEDAKAIVDACKGRDGRVDDVKKEVVKHRPPAPFNLGDLQREAYRIFRFTPSLTLSIAEKLYLDALISYPRTSSQKLPPSIDYRKIIKNLGSIGVYRELSANLLKGKLVPNQGSKDDPAHPAIHPTGEVPKRRLESMEWKLYDLIVKRFFATFGEPAVRENVTVTIDVNGYKFLARGRTTVNAGWTVYYKPYGEMADIELPAMKVNDNVRNLGVKSVEKYTQPPMRFNQATLVEKMEKEEIGTKATRAEIVRTLIKRGYVTERMEATELGFAVVEVMRRYMPDIISTDLTRSMEKKLDDVEINKIDEKRVIDDAVNVLEKCIDKFKVKEKQVGMEMSGVIAKAVYEQKEVGACPMCKNGVLRIIRSKQSGKRFVGCSNYEKGCKAAMPLPQKGSVKTTMKNCDVCKWPMVTVRSRRYAWSLCINIHCPKKE